MIKFFKEPQAGNPCLNCLDDIVELKKAKKPVTFTAQLLETHKSFVICPRCDVGDFKKGEE